MEHIRETALIAILIHVVARVMEDVAYPTTVALTYLKRSAIWMAESSSEDQSAEICSALVAALLPIRHSGRMTTEIGGRSKLAQGQDSGE